MKLHVYDTGRYDGWTLDDIIAALRGATLQQLKRGTLGSLIARGELGGLLVAASKPEENAYHAIATDPPYALALHGYDWDSDISFIPALWNRFFRVLKPGGYIAFFAAPRLYHRAATACEQAGFTLYPFMGWRFRDGLPKPINLAELFDRDNVAERDVIGIRRGSGFTQANVDHGAQNRSHVDFAVHERHVSPEAQAWRGYYYGVNALKPCLEPILLAQKPISTDRVVDNIRLWGTGALNIGALPCRIAMAPGRVLCFPTARRKSRSSI